MAPTTEDQEDKLFVEMKSRKGMFIKDFKRKILSKRVSIFYNPGSETETHGFDFYVISDIGCTGNFDDSFYDPEMACEILFHGIVYHDGIRHLYAGREDTNNKGYLYYFNSMDGVRIFTALRDLENKYCMIDELDD